MASNKEELIKYRIERSMETITEAEKAIEENYYILAAMRLFLSYTKQSIKAIMIE